jgi:hypothetical protein
MWYLTSDSERPVLRNSAEKTPFQEQAPAAGNEEKADNALVPGSEYWLP